MNNLVSSVCDEDTLLDMIDRVEASADRETTAVIIGTKKAIQRLTSSTMMRYGGTVEEVSNGLVGRFFGRPVIEAPYRQGLTEFSINDDALIVVSSGNSLINAIYDKSIVMESSEDYEEELSDGELTDFLSTYLN